MKVKDASLFSGGKISLPLRPDITVDLLESELKSTFAQGKYEVSRNALFKSVIIIKKTGWTGLSVALKQKKEETLIRFTAFAPSAMVRVFLMGLIPMLILHNGRWKEMRAEFMTWASRSALLNR